MLPLGGDSVVEVVFIFGFVYQSLKIIEYYGLHVNVSR